MTPVWCEPLGAAAGQCHDPLPPGRPAAAPDRRRRHRRPTHTAPHRGSSISNRQHQDTSPEAVTSAPLSTTHPQHAAPHHTTPPRPARHAAEHAAAERSRHVRRPAVDSLSGRRRRRRGGGGGPATLQRRLATGGRPASAARRAGVGGAAGGRGAAGQGNECLASDG